MGKARRARLPQDWRGFRPLLGVVGLLCREVRLLPQLLSRGHSRWAKRDVPGWSRRRVKDD
eukprot:3897456-Lingulodinium_polyedra.AAC.1